jgi:hypothetical protein
MRLTSSNLRNMERRLKKPRKPRAKALTVLRLESGMYRTLPHHTPARLPKDLEDQVAIVRGRAMPKPSHGLLQLETRLLRTTNAESSPPIIQRYDHGAPGPIMIPSALLPTTPVPQAMGDMLVPFAGSTFGGHFNVESFEDDHVAAAERTGGLQVADYERRITPSAIPIVRTAPPAMFPAADVASAKQPRAKMSSGVAPFANEQSYRPKGTSALGAEEKLVADIFQRDLAAMLGEAAPKPTGPEDKQWDDTLRTVGQASPASAPPVAPVAPSVPKQNAHDVFNQMGLALNYANSFDLGSVDLSRRFDELDNEVALGSNVVQTSSTAASVPVQALTLDDFDMVADLAEISGAQSVPTTKSPVSLVNPNAPTTEQAATPATSETRGSNHE